jgi:hypothetical protein
MGRRCFVPKSENPYPDWDGFETPRYTPVPDDLFDLWVPHLSESELKVLLYICRRTFGFKKDSDAISLRQMTEGIVTSDGRRLDYGAGVAERSVIRGIQGLLAKGLIIAEKRSSPARGDETTVYHLRMRGEQTPARQIGTPPTDILSVPRSDKMSDPPSADLTEAPSARESGAPLPERQTQETVKQETVKQEDDSNPLARVRKDDTHEQLAQSSYIGGVIMDFSREFGDTTHDAANVTQALRLWTNSGLSEALFVSHLHEARRLTRLYQGKQGLGTIANKMAYYFQVLRDLLNQQGGVVGNADGMAPTEFEQHAPSTSTSRSRTK